MNFERIPHRVSVERLTARWAWATHRGDAISANPGDYRVTDEQGGARWSITPSGLDSGYRLIAGNRYESRGVVNAHQVLTGSELIASSEGAETASQADWVITDSDGNRWVVDAAHFHSHYRAIPTMTSPDQDPHHG